MFNKNKNCSYSETEFSCKRDGLTIRGTEYRPLSPKSEKMPIAIVSHGFMAFQDTVRHYAKAFAEMGYLSYCFDFSGGCVVKGKSDGKTTDMSVLTEVRDLEAVMEYARSRDGADTEKVTLMGCSQGGFVSALAAVKPENNVSELVLFYPALCIPDDARAGRMMFAKFDPNNIPDIVNCGPMKLGRRYVEDVICMDPFAEISGFSGSVLIVHGSADKVVDISYSQKAYEAYREKRTEADGTVALRIIENAGHGFSQKKDETALEYLKSFAEGPKNGCMKGTAMLRIYFVRHAEAMGNVKEFFQGRTDCEISERGAKQLECLAEWFRDIPIERIYSSPLKRTMSTAEAVNKYHALPITKDERLIEIDGGIWEGKPWSDLPKLYPVEYDLWQNHMEDFYIENGEKMTEVFQRMKAAVTDIAAQNQGKTIAVVSHGCALRNYLCHAMGRSISALKDVGWSDNTAVSLVEYGDDLTPKIIFKNSNEHLPKELSTLSRSKWSRIEDAVYSDDGRIRVRNLRLTDPEIFTHEEIAQGWKDASSEKLESRIRDTAAGKAIALAADFEGEPAGYVSVYPFCMNGAFGGMGYPEIVDFAVLEKFRGKGVGTRLMDVAEQIAAEYSDTVYLGVGLHSGYGSAQRLYIKRGYIPDGSGVWYRDKVCPQYAECVNDDDLNLYLSKKLR